MVRKERPVVLHVDDDASSLVMAEGALEAAGFKVLHASNGQQAIDLFEAYCPDLIIMDAVMPIMDGLDAIAAIRKKTMGKHIPILMTTGPDDLDSITRAYEEGATDFLTKPVNFFILPYRLRYMLRSKATADDLRTSQSQLDNAQRIARLGHWQLNSHNHEMSWSREFARIIGFGATRVSGAWSDFLEKIPPDQCDSVRLATETAIAEAHYLSIEFTFISEIDARTLRLEAEPYIDESGACTQMVGTLQDITEHTSAQQQIHDLAYFDLITGLPNRAQLSEQLNATLKLAERTGGKFALLFLDLDHFKKVNDSLGHDAGDDLLMQVSKRLSDVLRDSDALCPPVKAVNQSSHSVARLGGDEFVVLLRHIKNVEDAARVAERISSSVRSPYLIGDFEVVVTTTIGISVYPTDGRDADSLMKHADVAMYHAKEEGRNGFQFYSREIHEIALAKFAMEKDLKQAIEQDQLSLLYQPKIDLKSGAVSGVEALLRWNHPEKGCISPVEFIALAEETGLILPLGQWVLDNACKQIQLWIEKGLGPFSIAVNCSSLQFTLGNIIYDVNNALTKSGLNPEYLEIELTENLFLHNIDKGIQTLSRLKELGIKIALDDFGAGFSSLSYLKRLPVDKLKIDRSFVSELDTDKGDSAIVSAIISLSQNLGLGVVAEGVERHSQLKILLDFKCDEIQGFMICRPLSPDDFEAWLRDNAEVSVAKVSGF